MRSLEKILSMKRDLSNTTAEYSLNDNGSIKVDNQGYNTKGRMDSSNW